MIKPEKPKIAFWFRYGPAEHAELFHALPKIIKYLSQKCEVHYYGMNSGRPVPEEIAQNAVLHILPVRVDRTKERDKRFKTFVWLLLLPWLGIHSRITGVQAVFIDETVPLSAFLARSFFGSNIAFTVADMFVDVYKDQSLFLQLFGSLIKRLDLAIWRRFPVLFTRAKSTKKYLVEQGAAPERVYPVYDPCDFSLYHPADKQAAKKRFGFNDAHIVLVHHGILHPNKGNDRIIGALSEMTPVYPNLRYLLVGDGPEMTELKKLVEKLGIARNVVFTGWLPSPENVNIALNAGDIGLVMRVGNQSDDFHMTGALVHNMACGLPILAARLGGICEVIEEGRNGYLFDPSDMAEFKTKLEHLIKNRDSWEIYGRESASDARRHFDLPGVVRDTVSPLLKMLA